MASADVRPPGLPPLLQDFRALALLFIGLRLTFALVYQPSLVRIGQGGAVERGMSVYGDLPYYYQLVLLADGGVLPYRDYWFEFPPGAWGLYAGLYEVGSLGKGMSYPAWAMLAGLSMTVCDLGVLVVLRRLGERLHGAETGAALAWVYALLAAPAIIPWWTFEPLVALSMILSVWWLLGGRPLASAAVTLAGALTKYVPVLILPAVWRFLPARQALRYTGAVLIGLGLALGMLWGWGGRMAYASLVAQVHRASYQTVWALLDRNWRTGLFVPPEVRSDADTALAPAGNPPLVPGWARAVLVAVPGLYLWKRAHRRDDQALLAFYSATVVLFYLWAQGWSPQWLVVLLPLILLNFPHRVGVLVCVALTFGAFLEYPALFMRTAETGGAIDGALRPTYGLLVLARTGLLIGLVVALGRRLGSEADPASAATR